MGWDWILNHLIPRAPLGGANNDDYEYFDEYVGNLRNATVQANNVQNMVLVKKIILNMIKVYMTQLKRCFCVLYILQLGFIK